MIHVIPFGTSEPQDFAIFDKGVAIDGTEWDVDLEIYTMARVEVVLDPPLSVEWLSQPGGTVRVTGTEELALGKYYVRFRLTDATGKIGYAPNQLSADQWHVVRVPSK